MKTMKHTALLTALVLCFALCACAGNPTGYDQSFRDGASVPQMSASAVDSVVLFDLITREQKTLTTAQVEEFVSLYNKSTVKYLEVGTTPDYIVTITFKDGTTLKLSDEEDRLEVGYYKIVNSELVTFIKGLL